MGKGMTARAGCLMRDLAEIALGAETADAFRWEATSQMARFVGADYCSIHSATTPGGGVSATLFGGDPKPLVGPLRDCFRDLTQDEMGRALQPKTLHDTEVFSGARRDRLALYRDYMPTVDVRTYALRAWLTATGFTWLAIARSGPCDQRRFIARAAETVAVVFPVLALGERAHAPKCVEDCCRDGSERAALTGSEARVVDLLERGLTNREIGVLLGISVNTVRNRVASAFKRVGATRRAELVYLLRSNSHSNK